MTLDFKLRISSRVQKLVPILQLAKPEEAHIIPEIFNDAYKGIYPYKEFTDIQEVREMINDPSTHWILFKLDTGDVAGCYGFHINLEEKSGTCYGLAIKRKYQKRLDSLKIIIGCFFATYSLYKDKILIWSGEARTAHSITQYMGTLCGLKPIAFLPNKDIFFNRNESIIMLINHDKKALKKYRRRDNPNIIPKASYSYLFSRLKHDLVDVRYKNPLIELNSKKLNQLKNKMKIEIRPYKLSYEKITFYFENSDSFFEFLFTPHLLNCDRTQYKVSNLEELYIFIQELKVFIKKRKVRYFEVIVSSYIPTHQKMFYDAGIMPRGYLPSWKYNKEIGLFEDSLLFNYFKGKVDNIKIIFQCETLLNTLNYTIDSESKPKYVLT